jgi:S1-C subfamily serine protease
VAGPAPEVAVARKPATATLGVLLALALWAATTSVAAQPADEDRAIMQVVVAGAEGFYRRGTAFHTGNGVFYTNAHVVRGRVPEGFTEWYLAGTSATRSRGTWLGPFSVTCVHPLYRGRPDASQAFPFDVARLEVGGAEGLPALRLSSGIPTVGMRVRTKGFPAASRAWPPILYAAQGRIVEIDQTDQVFQVDIESGFALAGSSGSPVIGPDNTVVGILYASTREGRASADVTFAVSAQAARSGCPVPPS